MPAVAHTAEGFAQQELDRIEATLASLQTWVELSRKTRKDWDDLGKLRAVADALENAEDVWSGIK